MAQWQDTLKRQKRRNRIKSTFIWLTVLTVIGGAGYFAYPHALEWYNKESKQVCNRWCENVRGVGVGIPHCIDKCVAAWEATSNEDREYLLRDLDCVDLIGIEWLRVQVLLDEVSYAPKTKSQNIIIEDAQVKLDSLLNTPEKRKCSDTLGSFELWRDKFNSRIE